MKKCILDGARLANTEAVYRALGDAFQFPEYFGNNPDALWDALGDYSGEPVTIVWRDTARSAELLGPGFASIMTVLRRAAAEGTVTLELA